MKKLLSTMLVLATIVGASTSCENSGEKKKSEKTEVAPAPQKAKDERGYIVEVGQKAPDFDLVSPDGKSIKLSSLKGKVVMVQFTATWCSVCIKEMPHIQSEIWEKNKDNKDFALYGVMYKQGADDVKKMYELTNVTYPLMIDTEGNSFHLYAEKGAGVTRNVIIDKEGNIAFLTRLFNEEEFNGMVKKIDELLK